MLSRATQLRCRHARVPSRANLSISPIVNSLAELARHTSETLKSRTQQSDQVKPYNLNTQKEVSLRKQADFDLAKDLTSATSSYDYQRLINTKVSSLPIASSSKGQINVTSVAARRYRKARESSKKGSDFAQELREKAEEKLGSASQGVTPLYEGRVREKEIENDLLPSEEDAVISPEPFDSGILRSDDIKITKVKPSRPMKIAKLRKGLSRVLFSSGVHSLRDPRTGTWNFNPTVHDIPQPHTFAFHRCPPYITPSQDEELQTLAKRHQCRFVGSTSTVSKSLSQIYFAISGGKGVDLRSLSQEFSEESANFTRGAELPASILINKMSENCFSVDNDKTYDIDNILSDFGHVLEKMLTTESDDFQRFLLSSPEDAVPEAERHTKEAYYYSKAGSLLMRSQLDCHDPRLPKSGVFDIKTRACFPIRYDSANYQANSVYDIWKDKGYFNSYEREYYDLMRAAMLKYSFQVRIGAMDGIFLAYHNTSRIFGFQYVPLSEIDERIFGSTEMAEAGYRLSVTIFEALLQHITAAFPGKNVKAVIKHTPSIDRQSVTAYVQPQNWLQSDGPCPVQAITFIAKNYVDGAPVQGPIASFKRDPKTNRTPVWSVEYTALKTGMDDEGQFEARQGLNQLIQRLIAMTSRYVPEGESVESMTKLYEARQQAADAGRHPANNSVESAQLPPPNADVLKEDTEASAAESEQTDTYEAGQVEDIQETADSSVPENGEISQATDLPKPQSESPITIKWKTPGTLTRQLRREAKASGEAYEKRKRSWKFSNHSR